MNALLLPILSLWQREVVRFYRQPSRVMGALGTPFVFWLLIGWGMNYAGYFFPGALLLMVLFTSIFSTISVIEDRREGFLQAALVSPAPRWGLVLGKVLGASTLASLQALCFLVIAPWAGVALSVWMIIQTLGIIFITAFALTSLGFFIAWRFRSIQGFHAVINLFLFPLWILSGAMFPPDQSAGWIRAIMAVNPLSYSLAGLRRVLEPALSSASLPGLGVSIVVTTAFGFLFLAAAVFSASRRTPRDFI